MQRFVILSKKDLDAFISALAQSQKVVAPVARGHNNFSFAEVSSGKEITLKYIPTILPPKKYFLPTQEIITSYNKRENALNAILEYEKMVIFGVHTCDLAGIQCLNMVFADKPKDINYIIRKNKIAIIGLECNDYCDEYASCHVVGNHLPNGGYDLFFTDLGDVFIVHINTMLGDELVNKAAVFKSADAKMLKALESLRQMKHSIFKDEVNVKHQELKPLFDRSSNSKVWEDLNKRCVACGNCTNVCPTCYCFDIIDEPNLDLNTGVRYRRWDSCQNEPFAKVAGNENFRKERSQRQRHRYMRKFKYPVDKYSRYFCTGCGRCSRTCMAQIKLKETINDLAKETQ
ncbi:MAG: 4Fe-4S dicluster domain-containing protein [Candidatus Omnitrophica bacterium]|nr:4Fe-4S dicluster domain-containing protein [Candidatus Omnitrophota bacterium]